MKIIYYQLRFNLYKIVYELPNNHHYAFVSRSGSSSIGLMAMNYNKHPLAETYNNSYDFTSNLISPHRLMKCIICEKMPPNTIVVVRNPIDRLKSLVCRTGISIEKALVGLYWIYGIGKKPKHTERDWLDRLSGDALYHFRPVSTIVEDDSICIPFEKIHEVPQKINIDAKLPHVNKNILNLSDFSEEEMDNIKYAYSADFSLHSLVKCSY